MEDDKKIILNKKRGAIIISLVILTTIPLMVSAGQAKQPVSGKFASEDISLVTDSSISDVTIDDLLTTEEKDYIANRTAIKAATIDGAAPFAFINKKGEIQGVFQAVLDRISEMTGLAFECSTYQGVEDMLKSDCDIIYGISEQYAPESMVLSKPFLRTETVLYMNSAVMPNQLEDKIYAAVKGSDLPEGVNEEYAVYYNTREDSLNAVENGQADYGYGNAFSVSYYTMLNGYKNVVTVPIGKEARAYCIGLLNDDEILLSIINKSLGLIDEKQMQTLILDFAMNIDYKVTFAMVIEEYGKELAVAIALVVSFLLLGFVNNLRISKKLRLQNRKYEMLSQISNEYIFEYCVKEKNLKLSDKFYELFTTPESISEVEYTLKSVLSDDNIDWSTKIIELRVPGLQVRYFKAIITSNFYQRGKTKYIIGKLVDVSEEVVEKEALIAKAQKDGLTTLYNATTAKSLIIDRMNSKKNHETDALILMDCDRFKQINDTKGHFVGDRVLEEIAASLKQIFRNTDILGRMGGDEFCVYMKAIPSVDSVKEKCKQLNSLISEKANSANVSVSIGIALITEKEKYEDIFQKADKALYKAKGMGKSVAVFWEDEET